MKSELRRLTPTSIRLRRRERQLLQLAADLQEVGFTDFIRSAALEKAREQLGGPSVRVLQSEPLSRAS